MLTPPESSFGSENYAATRSDARPHALESQRGLTKIGCVKRLVLLLVLLAAVVAGGCAQGCPTGLFAGVLTEQDGDLVVIPAGGGPAKRINWPSGHAVRRDGETLVVTDVFGRVVAREGDTVRLGGGETSQTDKTWTVCGTFEVEGALPGTGIVLVSPHGNIGQDRA